MGCEFKRNGIVTRADGVIDGHTVIQRATEYHFEVVFRDRDELGLVADRRFAPHAIGRAVATVCFEIPNFDFLPWKVITFDGEDVLGP